MLYLAQVVRKHGKPKLLLASRKRIDEVWMALSPPEILIDLPPHHERLGEGVLVIIDVNDKQQIISLAPALPQIVRSLQEYSSRLAQVERKIAEWRETMTAHSEMEFIRQQQFDEFLATIKQDAALQKIWDDLRDRELKELNLHPL
jgi:hypothetical protein